jgi:hypothetical protein
LRRFSFFSKSKLPENLRDKFTFAPTNAVMADSLEDDFATSDIESVGGGEGGDNQIGVENKSGSEAEESNKSTKRKQPKTNDVVAGGEEESEEAKRARKKRKMKEQDKNRKAKVCKKGASDCYESNLKLDVAPLFNRRMLIGQLLET